MEMLSSNSNFSSTYLRKIEENKTAILCMEDYIEKQRFNVEDAKRNLEKARQRLEEVIMERKTHEKLKEKAFQQFLMEEKTLAAETSCFAWVSSFILMFRILCMEYRNLAMAVPPCLFCSM